MSNPNTVIIKNVRLSYAHLFEPWSNSNDGEKKYSAVLIIPKNHPQLDEIKAAIKAAFTGGATRFGGSLPTNWKKPLRDGDTDRADDPAYQGAYFINASCKGKPGVVEYQKVGGENRFIEVTDQTKVYNGCYVMASVTFFPFNNSGNKGVAAGLNNVCKLRDGEPLGGRVSAASEFAGEDLTGLVDAPAADNYDDIF